LPLLEENSVIHHDVSQSLLLLEIRFFGDSLITRNTACHVTTQASPSTYVGIHLSMWVRLLSPKVEDNRIYSTQNKNSARQNLLADTMHKSANIVQY
jgi:hypothetical protein